MNQKKWYPILLAGIILLLATLIAGCDSPPIMDYGPASFEFSAEKEGATASSQTLTISNTGGGILDWSLSSDVQWLNLSLTSGSSAEESKEVAVSVDISGMNAGSYSGTITITTHETTDSTQIIPVNLVITSVWHEELLQVDCALGTWCEESILFNIEEHQEIHLWWFAYGEVPFVALFLERPDGTCYAGYADTMGGVINLFTPSERCHFFRHPDTAYALDLGKSGRFSFYSSTTFDEHCGVNLYPPGQYRLKFDVAAEWPYYNEGNKGDPIQTIIKVKYRIE